MLATPADYKVTETDKFLDALFETTRGDVDYLKGRVLTVIDAITDDKERREAIKDLVHQAFSDYFQHRHYPLNSEINKKIKIAMGDIEDDGKTSNNMPDMLPSIK